MITHTTGLVTKTATISLPKVNTVKQATVWTTMWVESRMWQREKHPPFVSFTSSQQRGRAWRRWETRAEQRYEAKRGNKCMEELRGTQTGRRLKKRWWWWQWEKTSSLADGTLLRPLRSSPALARVFDCLKPLQIFTAQERCHCLFSMPTSNARMLKHTSNRTSCQSPDYKHGQRKASFLQHFLCSVTQR